MLVLCKCSSNKGCREHLMFTRGLHFCTQGKPVVHTKCSSGRKQVGGGGTASTRSCGIVSSLFEQIRLYGISTKNLKYRGQVLRLGLGILLKVHVILLPGRLVFTIFVPLIPVLDHAGCVITTSVVFSLAWTACIHYIRAFDHGKADCWLHTCVPTSNTKH